MSGQSAAILFLIIGFVVYMVPTFVAMQRGHAAVGTIVAINLLLGWTVLGWFWALFWALGAGGTKAGGLVTDEYGTPIEESPDKTCPMCAETVKVAARICRFCGHQFEPAPSGS